MNRKLEQREERLSGFVSFRTSEDLRLSGDYYSVSITNDSDEDVTVEAITFKKGMEVSLSQLLDAELADTLPLIERSPPRILREVPLVGFYIRKGFNFGPLRLNLSRSGLGASIGVKGARIGVGPRGSYVHLGRGGLYYRQTIAPPSPREQPPQDAPPVSDGLQEILSSAAQTIVDS